VKPVPLTVTVVPGVPVFGEQVIVCAEAGVAGMATTSRARMISKARTRNILLPFILKSPFLLLITEGKFSPSILLVFSWHLVWGYRSRRSFPAYLY